MYIVYHSILYFKSCCVTTVHVELYSLNILFYVIAIIQQNQPRAPRLSLSISATVPPASLWLLLYLFMLCILPRWGIMFRCAFLIRLLHCNWQDKHFCFHLTAKNPLYTHITLSHSSSNNPVQLVNRTYLHPKYLHRFVYLFILRVLARKITMSAVFGVRLHLF